MNHVSNSQHHYSSPLSLSNRSPAPLLVAGYARVSTDLQREKESIKTQIELIEKYCADNGHKLVDIYTDDGVSGTTALSERDGASRMLADAAAGKFKALVIYKSDRIGRDPHVNEDAARTLYDGLGIEFKGIAETIDLATPLGRCLYTFASAMGRLERENTLQRSHDATIRLAKAGIWLGGIVPFGYRTEGKGRSARLRLADEEIPGLGISEVDVVRLIYHLAAEEGKSCIAIAETLSELGIPTCYERDGREVVRGKRKQKTLAIWTAGRVRCLLIQETYHGVHRWGKKPRNPKNGNMNGSDQGGGSADAPSTIERAVPAIVDEATWKRAQYTLQINSLSRPDVKKRLYLLRGLMRCALCGLTYIGTVSGGRSAEGASEAELEGTEIRNGRVVRPYYQCNGKTNKPSVNNREGRCHSGHLRACVLESLVWDEVLGFVQHPDPTIAELRAQLAERYEGEGAVDVAKELEALRRKKEAGDDERAVLYRLFRKGSITEADLDRQLAELTGEDEALAAQIERLEKQVEKAKDAENLLENARGLLEKLATKLSAATANGTLEPSWDIKRRLIEELVATITVSSVWDDSAPRGQQRVSELRVTYTFEPREITKPRHGKSPAVPAGLALLRVHSIRPRTKQLKRDRDEWVRAALEAKPGANLGEIIEWVHENRGVKMSVAHASRIRSRIGLAPDNFYTRMAKARFMMKKVETKQETKSENRA